MSSGIVCHFEPFLPRQPSAFAIAIVTSGPSRISPVAFSIAHATQLLDMPSPFSVTRSGEKRPQELMDAMMKALDQDGRPWMTYRFCIVIRGEQPMRFAISSAIKQFETLSR